MKRSILRHYIGNRDDIIVALSERYLNLYPNSVKQNSRLLVLVDILFGERDQYYINKSIVTDAIYAQARRLDAVRQHQQQSLTQSVAMISMELMTAQPNATDEKVDLVARGILASYLHSESMLPLGYQDEIRKLKEVSLLLLKLLDE